MSDWKPCWKKPIEVAYREQEPNETNVSTREGLTPLKPDDLIMRGVHGEIYPIGREIFAVTYSTEPPTLDSTIAEQAKQIADLTRRLEEAEAERDLLKINPAKDGWFSQPMVVNFHCDHGVFNQRNPGSSLCYTTSKERADWIAAKLNQLATAIRNLATKGDSNGK